MKLKMYAIVTTLLLVLMACGGTHVNPNGGGSSSGSKQMAVGFSMFPGFHALSSTVKKTTTAEMNWSLVPKVYAQTQTTTTYSGSYNASCASAPSIGQDGALALFGMGQIGNPQCNDFLYFLNDDGTDSGAYSVPADVQGSGQITLVRVTFGLGNTTLTRPDSGHIDIWLHRNNAIAGHADCQPTLDSTDSRYKCVWQGAAINVLNGDTVTGAIKVHAGDNFKNVQVFVQQG